MADPLQNCIDKLNLEDPDRVKRKAEEFLTKVSKLPNKLFKGPHGTYVCSLQLAHESLKYHDWNTKNAAVLAGCTVAAYENTMSAVRKHLNMLPDVTFDNLMVALGSSTMKVPVDELWKDFQHFYLEQFKGVQQKNIMRVEINRTPCWKGATVYCCAQALKHNLNKTKLKELCACSMTELNKSIKEIQTKSKKKLEELKERMTRDSSSNKRKRGIKRTFEDKDSGDSSEEEDDMADQSKTRNTKKRQKLDPNTAVTGNGTPKKKLKTISGIVSMVDYTDYTTTKQFRDYQTWKTEILERLRDIVSA